MNKKQFDALLGLIDFSVRQYIYEILFKAMTKEEEEQAYDEAADLINELIKRRLNNGMISAICFIAALGHLNKGIKDCLRSIVSGDNINTTIQ